MFSKPGGGTRVGERLSGLAADAATATRPLPGLECAPFVVAHASRRDASVFDNGLGLGRTDWIRDGELAALRPDPAYRGPDRAAGHARRSTTSPATVRRVRRRRWTR